LKTYFTLLLALACCVSYAQTSSDPPPVARRLGAQRTATAPKIDGMLDEAVWRTAVPATDFTQFEPINGGPAAFTTEVYVLYDDQAIYVGAMLHDPSPDSILHQLSKRDGGNEVNADYFGVAFDTYNDDLNAFQFIVSAAGVQTDMRNSSLGEDVVWDAVWLSAVKINADGWVAELEIPFSALRFSGKEVQDWGFQIQRVIRRTRESQFWNHMDKRIQGQINQYGALEGLKGLKPPVRIAVTPYVSGYVEHYSPGKDNVGEPNTRSYFSAGADLKLGVSKSFTLDMTLVPDFGQVVADNQILNLSPFEVQFQENRQFFTEGTELFNIGNLFYSRRVGGRPRGFRAVYDSLQTGEELVGNPDKTRLVNAFKLSGRTEGKAGLGVFNGITAPSYATVSSEGGSREVLTQDFTNYNVAVWDQGLKNNSYISVINTNRLEANGYVDNVTGGRFKLSDAGNNYFATGSGALSQQWTPGSAGPQLGFATYYSIGKSSGNLTFDVGQNIESHTYDPTGMGFLLSNNEVTDFGSIELRSFEPRGKFVSRSVSMRARRTSLYNPLRHANFESSIDSWFQLKSFDFFGAWLWINPNGGYDFFEPRVMGRQVAYQGGGGTGFFLSSNYGRRFALDINFDYWGRPEMDLTTLTFSIAPRVRLSDRLSLVHSLWHNIARNEFGFVNFDSEGNSLIGTRTRRDIENVLSIDYIFTNRIAVSFRGRHVWSGVHYHSISELGQNGDFLPTLDKENYDINFNVFNIDAVFQWRFAPGSDIFIVWKRSILNFGDRPDYNYARNLGSTFTAPQVNSLSVRVLYYIDFGRMLARRGEDPNLKASRLLLQQQQQRLRASTLGDMPVQQRSAPWGAF
jgi:hypothetical protein